MKLPRFGLRLGTMLLLIIALGAGMALERFRARMAYCKAVASRYRRMTSDIRERLDSLDLQIKNASLIKTGNTSQLATERSLNLRALAELETRIRALDRASTMPWLPLPPGRSNMVPPDF